MDVVVGSGAESPYQHPDQAASNSVPTVRWREVGASHRLKVTRITTEDDPEAYLRAFKRVAVMANWPRYQWATILIPNLMGVAQAAVNMPVDDVQQYDKVKEVIFGALNILEETYCRWLRAVEYDPGKGPRWLANCVRMNRMCWLKPVEWSTEEMVERAWLEQYCAGPAQGSTELDPVPQVSDTGG